MRKEERKAVPQALCTGQVGLILHLLPTPSTLGWSQKQLPRLQLSISQVDQWGISAPFARSKTPNKISEAEGSKRHHQGSGFSPTQGQLSQHLVQYSISAGPTFPPQGHGYSAL